MDSDENTREKVVELLLKHEVTVCVLCIEHFCLDDLGCYVSWANDVLQEADRFDDVSELVFLSSLESPFNYYEIRDSIFRILQMLGLSRVSHDEAVSLYCYGLMKMMASALVETSDCLRKIAELYSEDGNVKELEWFYYLNRYMDWMDVEIRNEFGFPDSYSKCVDLFVSYSRELLEKAKVAINHSNKGILLTVDWGVQKRSSHAF